VSLNIKNEETHRLVRQLAELTGQSQTSAVEDAVRRRIAEIERDNDREARIQRLLEIGRQTAAAMNPEMKKIPHGDFLYDEMGLPR
jgi:antitoxin VapB